MPIVYDIGDAIDGGSVDFDVQGTIAKTQAAAQTAQELSAGLQQFGDSSSEQQAQQVWAGVVNGFNQIVPGGGTALDTFYGLIPHAQGGPGYCVTDPPPRPLDPSWSHYLSYTQAHGNYAAPAAGSFEAWAYPYLVSNAELEDNCYQQVRIPWDVLLASLVQAWNARHQGPAKAITRTGLGNWGSMDPLAYAMMMATLPPPLPGQFAAVGPSTVSVSVNSGPRTAANFKGLIAIGRSMAPKPIVAAAAPAPVAPKPAAPTSGASPAVVYGTTAVVGAGAGLAVLHVLAPKTFAKLLSHLPLPKRKRRR